MSKLLTVHIRPIKIKDTEPAVDLIWRVFSEFEAPEYSEEGIAGFKEFIEPDFMKNKIRYDGFRLWGAYEDEKMIGAIAVKPPLHISLLFVDKDYHRQGIARRLFQTVIENKRVVGRNKIITVNSSRYAIEVYSRLGFEKTGDEQIVNGLRFTPMEYVL